jgi:hypothetical protein
MTYAMMLASWLEKDKETHDGVDHNKESVNLIADVLFYLNIAELDRLRKVMGFK